MLINHRRESTVHWTIGVEVIGRLHLLSTFLFRSRFSDFFFAHRTRFLVVVAIIQRATFKMTLSDDSLFDCFSSLRTGIVTPLALPAAGHTQVSLIANLITVTKSRGLSAVRQDPSLCDIKQRALHTIGWNNSETKKNRFHLTKTQSRPISEEPPKNEQRT